MSKIEHAITSAMFLAEKCKCDIQIEHVPPVYVPKDFTVSDTFIDNKKEATWVAENGSVVHLYLLPF